MAAWITAVVLSPLLALLLALVLPVVFQRRRDTAGRRAQTTGRSFEEPNPAAPDIGGQSEVAPADSTTATEAPDES